MRSGCFGVRFVGVLRVGFGVVGSLEEEVEAGPPPSAKDDNSLEVEGVSVAALERFLKRWAPKPSALCAEKDFALEGWTRLASPSCLAKCGGQGASPRPSASSRAARARSCSSEPGEASMAS